MTKSLILKLRHCLNFGETFKNSISFFTRQWDCDPRREDLDVYP